MNGLKSWEMEVEIADAINNPQQRVNSMQLGKHASHMGIATLYATELYKEVGLEVTGDNLPYYSWRSLLKVADATHEQRIKAFYRAMKTKKIPVQELEDK